MPTTGNTTPDHPDHTTAPPTDENHDQADHDATLEAETTRVKEENDSNQADKPEADLSEDHRWEKFAAGETLRPEAPPHPIMRVLKRIRVGLTHEWTLAAAASAVLAVAMTWPLATEATRVIPHDLGDPLLLTAMLAWLGHVGQQALGGTYLNLWDSGAFWPATDSHLFTDTLLGYAPAALAITDYSSALLVYNLLYMGTFALAFFGCYVLLRQLGARVAGSVIGAAAFAYAPWKLAQAGHLQVLSVGGIALALAMLARGHGWSLREGFKPERVKPGWILGGWLVALWQVSIGMGMGIPFLYLLLAIAVVAGLFILGKRLRLGWWAVAANGLGGMVFSLGTLWMGDQHLAVARAYPESSRGLDYIEQFSPTWTSFIIAPEESRLWGEAHASAREGLTWAPEQTLLVGFTVLALAIAGLVWSCWTPRQRLFLALGLLVTLSLAMGPNFLDNGAWAYGLLYEYLPGFEAIRTPGRLVLYMSLILAVLAAGTITNLADRADALAHENRFDKRLRVRAPRRLHLLFLLPLPLILAEGLTAAENYEPPRAPVAFSELEGPVMVLPSDGRDTVVQFWGIDGFGDLVNGVAAFTPEAQARMRADSYDFPQPDSIAALREAGVKTVVVVVDWVPHSDWDPMFLDEDPWDVEVERTDGVIIYHL
ncbi:hypothetical protein [Natronoglycomyces albus]|uniref:Uncharacterized protein n=1 Tax=Natronoglycomyces albus TaxID=2811108 RepID=A0A895XJW4_9ACTN|nr:hypothetical protein [Natronoglycomyces albus]QSB05307.1 hypothetical protein JQS30_16415 [Natronoglycomyces albus]